MAIQKIKDHIKKHNLDKRIDEVAKAELGKRHLEVYIFRTKYLEEWGQWAIGPDGFDLVGRGEITPADVNKTVKKIAETFLDRARKQFSKPIYHIGDLPASAGLEVTQLVRGTTFQPASKKAREAKLGKGKGLTGDSTTVKTHIQACKEMALRSIPRLKSGAKALRESGLKGNNEDGDLASIFTNIKSGLHGHHGGVGADRINAQNKANTGSTTMNVPPTTGGAVNANDSVDELNPKPTDMSVLTSGVSQATDNDLLYDVVVSNLNDFLKAMLTWDREPRAYTIDGTSYTFATDLIYVEFALGDSAKGRTYTNFRSKYDQGTGGIKAQIDAELVKIEAKIIRAIETAEGSQISQDRLIRLKGSPSTADNIEDAFSNKIINNLTKGLKADKVKKTLNKVRKPRKLSYAHKNKKQSGAIGFAAAKGKHGSINKGRNRTPAVTPALSGLRLKELINQVLPETLLPRMKSPALVNRTGRLRRSAEVTNVLVGPRGGVEIDYTYRKDPYQTFEPGGNMGSTNRDPRKLIGGAVREVASALVGRKFIKVRSR